jgi:WhiB family redox-sensing transcriptional regulator
MSIVQSSSSIATGQLPRWQDQALCKADPNLFLNDDCSEAKAICVTCPVRTACLDWAIQHSEEFCIWGGMSPDERKIEVKRRSRAKRRAARTERLEIARFGTTSGLGDGTSDWRLY